MNNITFEEMQQIQHELRDKYGKWWGELDPDQGARTLLWLIGEASEVGDIIKKQGEDEIMNDPDVRKHFIEEMCDILMYFNDLMICFGITPEEVTEQYWKKHHYNMDRWK